MNAQLFACGIAQNTIASGGGVAGSCETFARCCRCVIILGCTFGCKATVAAAEGVEPLSFSSRHVVHDLVHIHGLHEPLSQFRVGQGAGVQCNAVGWKWVFGIVNKSWQLRVGFGLFLPGGYMAGLEHIQLAFQEKFPHLGLAVQEMVLQSIGVEAIPAQRQ